MIEINEAGIFVRKLSLRQRWNLFWKAMSLVFNQNRSADINLEIERDGLIQISGWYKPPGEKDFRYHHVSYDGKNQPIAFIDGIRLNTKTETHVEQIGRTFTLEVLPSGKEDR